MNASGKQHVENKSNPGFRSPAGRMGNFFLTMGVMLLSFFFYEMGMFGGIEGPLDPARIGVTLMQWGVTRNHIVVFLTCASVAALTWNWILNAFYRRTGGRLTCIHTAATEEEKCGAVVRIRKEPARGSRKERAIYMCAKGHRCRRADFQPIVKGAVSNSLWTCCLLFSIAFLLSA